MTKTPFLTSFLLVWAGTLGFALGPSPVGGGGSGGGGGDLSNLSASNLTSGLVPNPARLGTGSATSSTFLRGDLTWAAVPGASGATLNVNTDPFVAGFAYSSEYLLRNSTTNATPTELFVDGSSTRLTIASGKAFVFDIWVVGKTSGASPVIFSARRKVTIQYDGTTCSIVGWVDTIGGDQNAGTWGGIAVSADDTNKSLKILVTGAVSTNITWTARVAGAGL